ncbi:hypothetical protein [Aliiruegeria lutimaris]|uniref:Metal binding domain of Ada n=1 Tax=Aliiruegeria lutimaris TaxID=571298 RepID=A0A1G8J2L0_9RHOB|nr:hypothetical protein [Aliiruegeria lutimaris]SDI25505.1 hypothetical protein SAMN04488026_1001203 [Aliiruegeria lutimaris]
MPKQNRVLPTGEIVALTERGGFMGNRGVLHDDAGRLGTRRWTHRRWICCRLSFRGRQRQVMAPGAYTELFFLDEAVALAAGHRPCAECRRAAYDAYRAAWERAHGQAARADEIDRELHRDRLLPNRGQRRLTAEAGRLPDGTFILHCGRPVLLTAGRAYSFCPGGYEVTERPSPRTPVKVLTPASSLAVLAAGYHPELHRTAAV